MNKVSFCTQCYEKDYEFVLDEKYLSKTIENCNYPFNEKVVVINNSTNYSKIINKCNELVDNKIIDRFIITEEIENEINSKFNFYKKTSSNEKVYWIVMYNLAAIYSCRGDYIMFLTGDSYIEKILTKNFIQDSINLYNDNPIIGVTNLSWEKKLSKSSDNFLYEDEDFFYSAVGFSDQNWFCKKDIFLSEDIVKHTTTRIQFPHGDTFEMRAGSWLEQSALLRATYKHGYYIHKNFNER